MGALQKRLTIKQRCGRLRRHRPHMPSACGACLWSGCFHFPSTAARSPDQHRSPLAAVPVVLLHRVVVSCAAQQLPSPPRVLVPRHAAAGLYMNVGQMRYVSSPCRAALCRLLLSCSEAVTCCFACLQGMRADTSRPGVQAAATVFPDRVESIQHAAAGLLRECRQTPSIPPSGANLRSSCL